MQTNKAAAYFFITCGWISFGLGVVGLFLPILPTTPFMILAAACFNKGSPRFHAWLVNHKVFGPPIQDWKRNKVIRPRYKIIAAVTMIGSIVLVVGFTETIPPVGKICYSVFILSVLAYILTRKNE